MIDLFIESIIMIIKDIILVREQSLTFFKQILSVCMYVYGMTPSLTVKKAKSA